MIGTNAGRSRGQIAFEFMVVYSFVLVVFLVLFILISSQRSSVLNAQEYSSLQLVAQNIAGYIGQAVYAGSGYNASIPLSGTIGTAPYNVLVSSTGVVIASMQIGSQVLSAYAFSNSRNLVINGTPSGLSTNSIRLYVLPNGTGRFNVYNLKGVIYVDGAPAPTSLLAQSLNVTQIANIKAAAFNGINSYMDENGIAFENGQTAYTVTGWMYPEGFTSPAGYVYSEGSPTNGMTFSFGLSSTGNELLCTRNVATVSCTTTTNNAVLDQWQFFAAQTGDVYLNGTAVPIIASSESSFDSNYAGLGFNVGNVFTSQSFNGFNGLLADVQVYNTILSSSQLAALENGGIAAAPVNTLYLQAWYRLSGDGSDYSGNLNPMYLSNISYQGVAQLSIATKSANGNAPFVAFGSFYPMLTGFISSNGVFGGQGAYGAIGTTSPACEFNQTPVLTFTGQTGAANVTVTGFNGNASYVNGCGRTSGALTAWWPLNEGFGTTIHDFSTFGKSLQISGTYNGYPSWFLINKNLSNFQAGVFPGNPLMVQDTVGQNGWITVNQINPYNAIITNGSFAVSMWVNFGGVTPFVGSVKHAQGLFGDIQSPHTSGFQLVGYAGGNTAPPPPTVKLLYVGTNSLQVDYPGIYLPTGKWTLVTAQYSGATGVAQIYLNESLFASANIGAGLSLTQTMPFNIGNDAWQTGGLDTFNGLITNVQLYDSILNQTQINYLYNQGTTGVPIASGSLLGWWTLDGNANDLSANRNNGTVENTVTFNSIQFSNYTGGKPQYAIAFSANSGNVVQSSGTVNLLAGGKVAVVAWIDPKNIQTSGQSIFRYGVNAPGPGNCGAGAGTTFSYGIQASGVPEFSGYADNFTPLAGPAVNYNIWNFVAAMINGTKADLFVNGFWVNGTLPCTINVQPGNVVIGSSDTAGPGSRIFNGSIADVQVYNAVLTNEQMMQLYEQGLPPTYRINVTAGR